jgi:hypothetical protein
MSKITGVRCGTMKPFRPPRVSASTEVVELLKGRVTSPRTKGAALCNS